MAYTGTGTEQDPYLVSTFTDFITCAAVSGAYVKVVADIDAADDELYSGEIEDTVTIACAKLYADTKKKIEGITCKNSDFFTMTSAGTIENIQLLNMCHKITTTGNFIVASVVGSTLKNVDASIAINGACPGYKLHYGNENVSIEHCAFDLDLANNESTIAGGSTVSMRSIAIGRTQYCNIIIRNGSINQVSSCQLVDSYATTVIFVNCHLTNNDTYVFDTCEWCYRVYKNCTSSYETLRLRNTSVHRCLISKEDCSFGMTLYQNTDPTEIVTPEQLRSKEYLTEIGFLP